MKRYLLALLTIGGIIKITKGIIMKKKEYKLLLENWKFFLKEENSKEIKSGGEFLENKLKKILKIREEIVNTYPNHQRNDVRKALKFHVKIEKDESWQNDYLLSAYFVLDEEEEISKINVYGLDKNKEIKNKNIADIAFVEFQKINTETGFNYNLHRDNKKGFETVNKKNGFTITYTEFVKSGLGPLIYDIVLEFVSSNNCVLCSDRSDVSGDAQRVWDGYLKRSDVKNIQLDNVDEDEEYKVTPEFIEDDITQIAAENDKDEDNWKESSLSKGFYKESYPVINSLLSDDFFIVDIPGFKN